LIQRSMSSISVPVMIPTLILLWLHGLKFFLSSWILCHELGHRLLFSSNSCSNHETRRCFDSQTRPHTRGVYHVVHNTPSSVLAGFLR
jgi:hypothetical protein